ncbi:hypothetical protein LTR85_002453 [Meristemomyces frigidus]|nr:hypothetical protein LTR85_002453 [Meristemomyces frigidus]
MELEGALRWLEAPDPEEDYIAARQRYGQGPPGAGQWFLGSSRYTQWYATKGSRLWIHGKAGCCKTVLCSTIMKDVESLISQDPSCKPVKFFFTFSDSRKQTYRSLLLSLVTQLSRRYYLDPGLAKAYDDRRQPPNDVLEAIVISLVEKYARVFCIVDALDESGYGVEGRQAVIDGLETLLDQLQGVSFLATSRPEDDIKFVMRRLSAESATIDKHAVDIDISRYVEYRLARSTLARMSSPLKQKVISTLSEKADGMFRWAYCQIRSIESLRNFDEVMVMKKLQSLPKDLDETYERMLLSVDEDEQTSALTALRWIAFAERPLTLLELEEAYTFDARSPPPPRKPGGRTIGGIASVLSGLVTVDTSTNTENNRGKNRLSDDGFSGVPADGTIWLAHFSVKEYLISDRIRKSAASFTSATPVAVAATRAMPLGSATPNGERLIYHSHCGATQPATGPSTDAG